MWLFCVPVLPPSMVFCYTIVSSWTCWNALCKSVTAPYVSAREISETQELLPSCWWKSEQSSTASVHPLRAEHGERGAWAAHLPLAMQNSSSVLLLEWSEQLLALTKTRNALQENIVIHIAVGMCGWGEWTCTWRLQMGRSQLFCL